MAAAQRRDSVPTEYLKEVVVRFILASPQVSPPPPPPAPSLPYKVDTSRPSLRTDWTRLVPFAVVKGTRPPRRHAMPCASRTPCTR